jgi:hypothetical protein
LSRQNEGGEGKKHEDAHQGILSKSGTDFRRSFRKKRG